MTITLRLSVLVAGCMALAVVQASAQTSSTLPPGAMATVNGVVLPAKRLDQLVQVNGSQGRQDSAQLRSALKAELIARELLLQEAQRRGIANSADAEAALAQARESVLIDFLIQDEISKKPVTDAEVKAEYERQLAGLADAQQYQLRQAVFATEAQAKAAIASVRTGASLAKLAKENSTDASSDKEGLLGWLLPSQLVPAVSNVIVNLDKGAMTAAPIRVGDVWHVLRVEDKRKFVPPSLEQAQQGIRVELLQKRRIDLLNDLARKAKIDQ